MRLGVIIPAAGRSERFGDGDKLSADLGGRPILLRSIERLARRPETHWLVVAGPPDELDRFEARYGDVVGFLGGRIVAGGRSERWETVRLALEALPADCTHVAVHDAARPACSDALIDRVLAAARRYPAVVPGLAVSDTLKEVGDPVDDDGDGDPLDALAGAILGGGAEDGAPEDARPVVRPVRRTVDRRGLVAIQTPQVFETPILRRAHAETDPAGVTDDAELVERLGVPVHVVEGERANLKVTTIEDLEILRALLGRTASSATGSIPSALLGGDEDE